MSQIFLSTSFTVDFIYMASFYLREDPTFFHKAVENSPFRNGLCFVTYGHKFRVWLFPESKERDKVKDFPNRGPQAQ